MTFNNAAWAIDGALLSSSLARAQAYASSSGQEGIVQAGDLRVSALSTPGIGVQISAGTAFVLNKYQGPTSAQMYTVENPGIHTISADEMPPSNPAAKSYIVAVVVGDPEFSQTGHPFMLASDPPAGEEPTFSYVRPVLIPVAGTTVTSLPGANYPALPLARIDIPANTTTITGAMIKDLRKMARPRTQMAISSFEGGAAVTLNTVKRRVPNGPILTVQIPTWAVKAKVMGFLEGITIKKAGAGSIQVYIEGTSLVGFQTNVNEYTPKNETDRRSFSVGGEIDVRSVAGQTKNFSIWGWTAAGASEGYLVSDGGTMGMLQVYFEEQPT